MCACASVRACPFMVFMERGIETFFLPPGAAAVMEMGQKKILFILAHSYQLRLKVQMYDLIEVMAGTP